MKDFILGAVVGATVAATVVALITPKKGSELRYDIKKEAIIVKHHGDDVMEKAKYQAKYQQELLIEKAKKRQEIMKEKNKKRSEEVLSMAQEFYDMTHEKVAE